MGGLVAYTPNEQGVNIYLKKIDIRGISEDLDGNIWVASTNGLYYIKDGKGIHMILLSSTVRLLILIRSMASPQGLCSVIQKTVYGWELNMPEV